MTGRKLLHYQVLEKLGEGGMGAVYKARDTHLGRLVAVKVLNKIQPATPAERQRFYNEAKAASALNHPNIIHIYDIGNDSGVDFIVMEYVSGTTLAEVMRRKGIALSKTLRYATEIADGLNKAHAAGIVHRDLKPSNIMVNDDGVVKLLDFGLAKLVERAAPSDDVATRTVGEGLMPTREGTIVGTAAYMAPEQAEGKAVDARADVFSFGAVLYEMVSGQRAFSGGSLASTLVAVMTKDPPSLRHAPREVDRVIQRCLKKNPAERWHSMADVKLALEDLQQDYSSRGAELAKLSRRPLAVIAVSLGILVLGIVVAAVLLAPRFAAKEGFSDLNPRTLTTLAGSERSPSISPDGSQVAFAWNGPKQDNYDIYIQHISSSRLLPLTDDPAEEDHPAWSPDGRWIAFHRHVDQHKVGLFLVTPLGGPARQIWEADLGSRISWTRDGKWLLLPVRHQDEKQRGIFLFSVETNEKRQLTSPPAESSGDSEASISPDNGSLVFVRGGANYMNQLLVVHLDQKLLPKDEPRPIPIPPHWYCHSPVWTSDGREIVFSGGTLGNHSLWRSPADGSGPPQRLAFAGDVGIADLTIQRPSQDSTQRLVYSRRLDDSNIFRLNLREKASAPEQVIASTRNDVHPQYSPDGTRIAFESARSGAQDIWVSAADGSNQFALTSKSAYCGSPSWSPDGRTIAYESNADGRWDIYTIGATGENPQRLTNTPEAEFVPGWSRDGKWIYFASRVAGRYQVFKMPAAGGSAVPVTKNGGYMAIESVDGRSLLFTRDAGNPTSLWKLSFDTGEETEVAAPVSRDTFFPVREGLYVIGGRARRTLLFFGRDARESTVIRTFERMPAAGISLPSDGASLLYSQYDQTGSDLMLVENFR